MANPLEEELEDSEEDDEDYVPGEEESDEDISDAEPEEELEPEGQNPAHANGTTKKKLKKSSKKPFRNRGIGHVFSENSNDAAAAADKNNDSANGVKTEVVEKERADSLWADFLTDVTPPPKKKNVPKESNSSGSEGKEYETPVRPIPKQSHPSSSKVKVTELFEFAGETVEVTKEVDADSKEAKKLLLNDSLTKTPNSQVSTPPGVKRSGGVESVLGRISAKKNRLSTLEKTKLDWNKFKEEEGIDEDLKVHNKGKDGFLEKMDFLQRTDLRQFEVEKSLRLGSRTSK